MANHPSNFKKGISMEPMERAKLLVAQYFNKNAEKTDARMISSTDDVYVVWFCFILGGWKALVSTTVVDGMYYEVTHNRAKGETYLDVYKKWENIVVADGEQLHSFETRG
jgi:hypothetical protein